jgi:hypothetical protein
MVKRGVEPTMRHTNRISLGSALALFGAALAGHAADLSPSDRAGMEFFEKRVRPLFVNHCYECHSQKTEKPGGGLLLDTLDGWSTGGDSGPAIVPGDPDHSKVIAVTKAEDAVIPQHRLRDDQVAAIYHWIKLGAPDPDEMGMSPHGMKADWKPGAAASGKGWAFEAVRAVTPPKVRGDWAKTEIDRFILAGLEESGLAPVADADRVTLIRRVYFDVIGLPPTPAEIDAFVADPSPRAFESVVEGLLASPRFGERWGRHWLDVARYAESTGQARNYPYPYAWRYRDYVIDSFNKDKPYDRFIREQIAGDLLPAASSAQRDEQKIATGFLAIGLKDLNEKNRQQFRMDEIDEQIDTMSRSVLAMTISCARCHDHKFDPIPTAEYYGLAGIFHGTQTMAGVVNRKGGGKGDHEDSNLLLRLGTDEQPAASPVNEKEDKLAAARQKLKKLRKQKADAAEIARVEEHIKRLESKGADTKPTEPSEPSPTSAAGLAMGVRDEASPADIRILKKGEVSDAGDLAPRGFPGAMSGGKFVPFRGQGSGRLELAQWLTSRGNPLTARVMANRVWAHLFGQGIVPTVDNFGATGEGPTNPKLLDYLAGRFVSEGWSVKKMIRSVVLSRVYQLGGDAPAANYDKDPDNKLLWRSSPRRLEAEAIRDSVLVASGSLDLSPRIGSPVSGYKDGEIGGKKGPKPVEQGDAHRSVYLPIVRSREPEMLDVFDFPDPSGVVGKRDVTTVPTQALFMMNSPFVGEQAGKMAAALLEAKNMDDAGRVELAYRKALGRTPSSTERERALQYINDAINAAKATPLKKSQDAGAAAWSGFCQALFAGAEFRYVH